MQKFLCYKLQCSQDNCVDGISFIAIQKHHQKRNKMQGSFVSKLSNPLQFSGFTCLTDIFAGVDISRDINEYGS